MHRFRSVTRKKTVLSQGVEELRKGLDKLNELAVLPVGALELGNKQE